MGRSDYERGYEHADNDKYDPPGHMPSESLSRDAYDYYHDRREEYRKGYEDGKNEHEHEHQK